MPKVLPVTDENFQKLLGWLDSDRSKAADRYEQIRTRLIRIFSCRGCFDAEEMADETFNRVMRKIDELRNSAENAPAAYFHGVASNIYLEWLRERRRFSELPEAVPDHEHDVKADVIDRQHECLEECLGRLRKDDRTLVLEYYQNERSEKIENRRKLAEKLKMTANALQVKVLRIRAELKPCIEFCMQRRDI